MKLNEDQIKYLLYINNNPNTNITTIAKEFNVNKSTISRIMLLFFQAGLLETKGKCVLSLKGQKYVREVQEGIELLRWQIIKFGYTNNQELDNLLIHIYVHISDDIIHHLKNVIKEHSLIDMVASILEANGDWMIMNVDEGKYSASIFSLYSDHIDDYCKQCYLDIHDGKGYLVLEKDDTLNSRQGVTTKECISDIIYQDRIIPCIRNLYYLPINDLIFKFDATKRILNCRLNIQYKITSQIGENIEINDKLLFIFK